MKILNTQLENFASYDKLDFTFTDQGLVLVQGPTGAGKSTLMDAITWCLFGQTAKGGKADEVLSWPGNKLTSGKIIVELPTGLFTITRTRKPNDLYITGSSHTIRGKDLIDTQKIINKKLGFDYDLYMASAYFHEFSQTAQFFTTTAKNRREITEQLVDLTLATELQTKAKDQLKEITKTLVKNENQLTIEDTKLAMLEDSHKTELSKHKDWEGDKDIKIINLRTQFEQFEDRRNMDLDFSRKAIQVHKGFIKEVQDHSNKGHTCEACGQSIPNEGVAEYLAQVRLNEQSESKIELHKNKIKEIKLRMNPYEQQIKTLIETDKNPYKPSDIYGQILQVYGRAGAVKANIEILTRSIGDLELLQQVLADYRSVTITNSVKTLQNDANSYLANNFDGEFRVGFIVEDNDRLEVNIFKDGNTCSFTQLSKGQRCLLKLVFGIAVMKMAANNNNLRFSQAFFDEALSGLDETMKSKAFSLLQTVALQYESVYVIDHSEGFKTLFDTVYNVSLVNGKSQIEKT